MLSIGYSLVDHDIVRPPVDEGTLTSSEDSNEDSEEIVTRCWRERVSENDEVFHSIRVLVMK